MKVSLFRNDKNTAKDELILFLIVAACLAVGILLAVFRPAFWFLDSKVTALIGVIIIVLGAMYCPCLIYRLITNNRNQ